MRVGFIGLGRMGKHMSYNLLKAGHILTVHNRSQAKVEELARAGARPASSPRQVAEASEVVLACLPDVHATEEVFLGSDGIVTACRPGQVLVDHSTIGPATARRIAEAARERGALFLDAPISGGVERAQEGTLTIMVGGDTDAFERARPVFEAMGRDIRRMGDVGAGCVVKLVNQHLVVTGMAAVVEAMVLGTKAGADPEALFEVLRTSWGRSFMLERTVPRLLDRDFSPAAPLRLLRKDLGLILELGEEVRVRTLLATVVRELLDEARAMGLDESDSTALALPLEQAAGVEVRRKD